MKKHYILFAVFVLGVFMACQQASTQPAVPANQAGRAKASPTAAPHAEDDAKRITLKDAKAAFDAGTAFFIDTRAEAAYKSEHVKGAINIPAGETEKRIGDLPKDKQLIFYCS